MSQDILSPIVKQLELKDIKPDIAQWSELVSRILHPEDKVKIAFVGKQVE